MVTFYNRLFYTFTGSIIGHTCGIVYYLYVSIYKRDLIKNNYNTVIDYSTYGAMIGGSSMYIISLFNKKNLSN